MFLSWGFTFILVVFSEIAPLFDLWSKLVGQVFQPSPTSRTPIQLTTRLRISLLGLAESCVHLKGKAKYLKGTPIQISGAPFLCSFHLHITVHHKFRITQQPPQLSKSAVFLGTSLCCQLSSGRKPGRSSGVLPSSQNHTPSWSACCPVSQDICFVYFAQFYCCLCWKGPLH